MRSQTVVRGKKVCLRFGDTASTQTCKAEHPARLVDPPMIAWVDLLAHRECPCEIRLGEIEATR